MLAFYFRLDGKCYGQNLSKFSEFGSGAGEEILREVSLIRARKNPVLVQMVVDQFRLDNN